MMKIYVGNTRIKKVYHGENRIYAINPPEETIPGLDLMGPYKDSILHYMGDAYVEHLGGYGPGDNGYGVIQGVYSESTNEFQVQYSGASSGSFRANMFKIINVNISGYSSLTVDYEIEAEIEDNGFVSVLLVRDDYLDNLESSGASYVGIPFNGVETFDISGSEFSQDTHYNFFHVDNGWYGRFDHKEIYGNTSGQLIVDATNISGDVSVIVIIGQGPYNDYSYGHISLRVNDIRFNE